MSSPIRTYIGLGSNLNHPPRQIQRALHALSTLPQTELVNHSCWYRSAAIGPGQQPDYINGAAAMDTRLSPEALLDGLLKIESNQGRARGERWAARTLDLDILLYGDQIVATDRLKIPHPRLKQRNFVLYPLSDLAPQLVLPDGQALKDLVAKCGMDGMEKLGRDLEEIHL